MVFQLNSSDRDIAFIPVFDSRGVNGGNLFETALIRAVLFLRRVNTSTSSAQGNHNLKIAVPKVFPSNQWTSNIGLFL